MFNVVSSNEGVSDSEALAVVAALENLGKGSPLETSGRLTKRSRSSPNLHHNDVPTTLASLHQMPPYPSFISQSVSHLTQPQPTLQLPSTKHTFSGTPSTPGTPSMLRQINQKPGGSLIVQEISPFVVSQPSGSSLSTSPHFEEETLNAFYHSASNGGQLQYSGSSSVTSTPATYYSGSSSKPFTPITILQQPDDLCVVGEHRICQSRVSIRPCDVQDLSVYVVPVLKPNFIIPEAIRYKSIQFSSKHKSVIIKLSFPGMMEFSQILKHDFPSFDGRVMLLYKHPFYPDTHSKEFKLISKLPSNQSKKRPRKESIPSELEKAD